MRLEKVSVIRACNQTCAHCRTCRSGDDQAWSAPESVRQRIHEATERRPELLVLTGGEPALVSQLSEYVARAKSCGARVAVETNATLVDAALAMRLRESGLDEAHVRLAGFTEETDGIMSDHGGFRRLLRGLEALRRADVRIELVALLTRSSLASVPRIPDEIVAALGGSHGVSAIRVGVPLEARTRGELVTYLEAAASITELVARARLAKIPVSLAAGDAMPPCAFPEGERVLALFSLDTGDEARRGFVRLPLCSECAVQDRCPGLATQYMRTRPAHDLRPLPALTATPKAALYEDFESLATRELVAREPSRHVIRVNFHCNQACTFCFLPTYLPPAADSVIREAITRAAQEGAAVVFSGGEPTLHPRLADYVRLARRATRQPVAIETNAIELADATRVRDLADAELSHAIVSLHGSRGAISDAITRSPGTFEKTVAGIDNLLGHGVEVTLSFVLCRANASDLPDYFGFVARRWARTRIRVSFVEARSDLVPWTTDHVLSYSLVMPALVDARRAAEQHGVSVDWPAAMRDLPRCIVPPVFQIEPSIDRESQQFVKVAACRRCRAEPSCPGIQRSYAEVHGIAELVPEKRTSGGEAAGRQWPVSR